MKKVEKFKAFIKWWKDFKRVAIDCSTARLIVELDEKINEMKKVGEMIDIEKIIQIESGGNPNAVSNKGAVGLCQITPICLQDFNEQNYGTHEDDYHFKVDLFKPEINKQVGEWYINKRIPEMFEAYLIPDCDILRCIAYNFGIGNLLKWYRRLPKETRDYIQKYEALK